MCFESSNLNDIEKWQSTMEAHLKFLKQTFVVSFKILCRKWEGETIPK